MDFDVKDGKIKGWKYRLLPVFANFLAADAMIDEYRDTRAALGKVLESVMASADEPEVVAGVVLQAATDATPRLRYTAGGLANRLRLLRRFAPARMVDQHLTHAPRGQRVELATVLHRLRILRCQPQPGLVDQRGRRQRVPAALATHLAFGQPMQFIVDQGDQPAVGREIAGGACTQQLGDRTLRHGCASRWPAPPF